MYEVVRTIELSELPTSENEPLRFRIEVLRQLGPVPRFFARLLRWETFSLKPFAGGVEGGGSSDETVLVVDEFWDWEAHQATSVDEAAAAVVTALRQQLPGANIPDPFDRGAES